MRQRARTDLWEPREGNLPGPPEPFCQIHGHGHGTRTTEHVPRDTAREPFATVDRPPSGVTVTVTVTVTVLASSLPGDSGAPDGYRRNAWSFGEPRW